MRRAGIFLCALAVAALCGTAWGQDNTPPPSQEELAKQLSETQTRLEAANRRIDELNVKFDQVCNQFQGVCGQVEAAQQTLTTVQSQLKGVEERSREIENVTTGLRFKPYGYVKLDAAFDTTRTSGSDSPAFVLSEMPGFANDKHFTMTVRQTRLGMDILGPDMGEAKTSGKVEIDFYAPASVENKAEPMLRQAFWIVNYPTWNILAGQTWEVFSPLFPNTLNYVYLALSGNPGYRKPMVRYERMDTFCGDKVLQSDFALSRDIGANIRSAASLDDEGSDAAWPNIEARVGVKVPTSVGKTDTAPGKPLVVGLSGVLGQEEYDPVGPPGSGRGMMYSVYGANIDWSVPVCSKVTFNGEVWGGRNLDGFMGGIGQGVNTTLGVPVDAYGGWTQLSYYPHPKWTVSTGVGLDDPTNDDLSANNRASNATYFTNAMYAINPRTLVGVELTYMKTDYIAAPDGEDFRVQNVAAVQLLSAFRA